MSDDDAWRFIPVEADYVWPAVSSVNDFERSRIDAQGRPWIDGHRVNTTMYEAFQQEWMAFYTRSTDGGSEQPGSSGGGPIVNPLPD